MLMETLANRQIAFSDEQAMMLDAAKRFVADKSPTDKVRKLIEEEAGFDADVWAECAALGWTGMALDEEFGGSGLGFGALVPVVEQMGRGLMATPLVPTVLAGGVLQHAGTDAQRAAYLPKIAEGGVATLALGERDGGWGLADCTASATRSGDQITLSGAKVLVEHANIADVVLVSVALDGATALVLLEGGELGELTRETVIDETRRVFRFSLDGISVPADRLLEPGKTADALRFVELASGLLCAADALGGADSCLGVIVEYLNTRKQFGKLIGSYQALKHPASDILTGIEQGRSLLYHAATMFDEGWSAPAAEIAVRMAKAAADDVAMFAGDRAIQFHGGFGFTYECDAQLYRRRSIWNGAHFGDPAYQKEKLADLLF